MQLYLQQQQLEDVGIHHFDEWVSLYAQPKMAFEMKPDGGGFRMHTRLATFVNLPELSALWRLHLTVQAHAVFAADLSLVLPDGTTLDTVTAATGIGVWQSIGHIVNEIPATIQRLHARSADAQARIATIDRELARLEQWDGQQRYDDAVSELNAINAVFAAAEEQTSAEQSAAAAATPEGRPPPANDGAPAEEALTDVLLALAQEECAGDVWHALPTLIPPAPEALAYMAAEVERQTHPSRTVLAPVAEAQPVEVPVLADNERSGMFRNGQRPQRRPLPIVPHGKVEVRQLSLFELGS
jgi:hypothetical protein